MVQAYAHNAGMILQRKKKQVPKCVCLEWRRKEMYRHPYHQKEAEMDVTSGGMMTYEPGTCIHIYAEKKLISLCTHACTCCLNGVRIAAEIGFITCFSALKSSSL